MPTYDQANHPNRFKRMAEPVRDPRYPRQSYYADQERESEERRRLAEGVEVVKQRREVRKSEDGNR